MAAPIYVAGMSTPVVGDGDDTVVLNLPSGILANDLLVPLVFCDAGAVQTITGFNGANYGTTITSTSNGARRGIVAAWAQATGYETIPPQFTVSTTNMTGLVSGTIALIRGALTVDGVHAAMAISFSGGDARPSSVTTDVIDELALCAIVYRNTGTIADIDTNGWVQDEAAQNDGTNSFSFQRLVVPTAQTISGGTAVLGTSGDQWASITFAVKALYPEGTTQSADPPSLVQVG